MPDPAPAAPAPIVLPEFKAVPVVQPVPEPSAAPEAAVATTAAPKAKRAPARAVARSAPAAVATQAAAPTAATPVVVAAPVIAAEAPAPIASAAPQVQPAATTSSDNTSEIALGVLGLAALGGLGIYAATRRRRTVSEGETRSAAAPIEPVAARETLPAWTPASATAASAMFERKPESAAVPAAGLAAMIPPGPLPRGDAMVSLFDQMALAAPDADNPFSSAKRRRQRVRWLMKQHEYSLREQGWGDFDFRMYAPSGKLSADEGAGKEVIPA